MKAPLSRMNFHHLHYFWAVAKEGNLTRAAMSLKVSQSALSAQIQQLESALGQQLFLREKRKLVLSEAGAIAFRFAEEIFAVGDELLATLKGGRNTSAPLRVGTVATLSRNFQESFIAPTLSMPNVQLRLQSGRLTELLTSLAEHELDVVLSNHPTPRHSGESWRCRRIARQKVSIVGRARKVKFSFARDLGGSLMILPGPESEIRTEFDALCEQRKVKVSVFAEVDDMASMRLLARDTKALALVPSVVVRDELKNGTLTEHCVVPGLFENFYAITVDRHFPHPLLHTLLDRTEEELLAMGR